MRKIGLTPLTLLVAGALLAPAATATAILPNGELATAQSSVEVLDRPEERLQNAIETHVAQVEAERLAEEQRQRELRRDRRRERFLALPAGVSRETLESIAECESGGDPQIVSADGSYRGKYQFSPATWESVGGTGDPAVAPEIEQDHRAALLYVRSGPGQWPVCGR